MCFPGARDDEWLRPRVARPPPQAHPRRRGDANGRVLLPRNGRRNKLEKDRERRVFLARFKQPGRFSSAENAAFKSRSASFPHRKRSSCFLFFSYSKRSGCLGERIKNGEGANGDVQSTGRIARGGWVAHDGGREEGEERSWCCLPPAEATDKSRSQAGFFIKNVFQKQGGERWRGESSRCRIMRVPSRVRGSRSRSWNSFRSASSSD